MDVAIIGGGPAGLRAAEVASSAGARVTVFDAKASVGRKLLVAGVGGLNITRDEPVEAFAARYRGLDMPEDFWTRALADFGPHELREWACGLGIATFVASTGRVYPGGMKAAPLLRRWVHRLRAAGVRLAMRHRWSGWKEHALCFETPDGEFLCRPAAAILALGGGSWPETGSDGGWAEILAARGVEVEPLRPANCGWEVAWPPEVLAAAEGRPLKNIVVRVGDESAVGELLITRYGLEGGAIYQLGAVLRGMERPEIFIDFKPSLDVGRLVGRLGPVKRGFLSEAKRRWRLGAGAEAILGSHDDRETWTSAEKMARAVKNCRVRLLRPRPLAEAISTAGGVRWREIDERLMLRRAPGVFVAGEMIDWEAPTGGYLMQGAFATGTLAARGAVAWMRRG